MLDNAEKKIGTGRRQPATTDGEGFTTPAHMTRRAEGAATSKRPAPSPPAAQWQADNRFAALAFASDDDICIEAVDSPVSTQRPPNKSRRIDGTPTKMIVGGRASTGHVVHDGADKPAWILQPSEGTKVLVIGDSNLRHADAAKTPDDWEIHAFPGGKFKHVATLLDKMLCPATLEHVIVQVGINHRSEALDVTTQDIGRMERCFSRFDGLVWTATGVSVAASLDVAAKQTVRRINQSLKRGAPHFIEPLGEDEVGISPTDDSGIHHDVGTVDAIISSMIQHVRSLN
jgi:hypothetical protein